MACRRIVNIYYLAICDLLFGCLIYYLAICDLLFGRLIYYLAIYDLLFWRILIFGEIVVEGETMVGNVGGCKNRGFRRCLRVCNDGAFCFWGIRISFLRVCFLFVNCFQLQVCQVVCIFSSLICLIFHCVWG